MRSWRSVMSILLIITFCFMTGFMVWANIDYYKRIEETYQRENEQTAKVWSSTVASRLGTVDEHLHEMMLMLYDNVELQTGTPIMQYMMRKKCLDLMADKLLVSDVTTCLYVLDRDTDMMLFSAAAGTYNMEILTMKKYLRNQGLTPTRISDKQWEIVEIGDWAYFAHGVSLGKYVVGALCKIQNFDISKSMNVLGSETSCLLVYQGEVYAVSGSDWSDRLVLSESGEVQSSEMGLWLSTSDMPIADATVVLAAQPISSQELSSSPLPLFFITSGACLVMLLITWVVMRRMVSRPVEEMLTAIRAVKGGDIQYRIERQAESSEFEVLYDNFNDMVSQIQNMRIEAYDRAIQQQKDELTMLRAQIKPHFYLNAITTVSNMTYQGRPEDIRTFLASLAKYMRYMLNLQEKYVTVGAEMEHVRNYLQMQRIKFPGSVDAYAGCASSVAGAKIPYLLLFTVVENAFKHAMSLSDTLKLMICCEPIETENIIGCRIVVQDNGPGFSQEVLDMFRPGSGMSRAKDHFGLSNVSRTLQLVYGRNDLLHIENAASGGARVELWIPQTRDEAVPV